MTFQSQDHANFLSLHVLGDGEHEGIILCTRRSGTKEVWGVIDCCARSVLDSRQNLTLKKLREFGVSHLDFVCLTHPHFDHSCGLHQLLEAKDLTVDRLYLYCDMDAERLSMIFSESSKRSAKARKISTSGKVAQSDIEWGEDISKQLRQLHKLILKLESQGKTKVFNASEGAVLYPFPLISEHIDESSHRLVIRAIGPTQRILSEYWDRVKTWRDKSGYLRMGVIRQDLNLLSMCLDIEFAGKRLLLAGDTVDEAWNHILENEQASGFGPYHIVKVAHHGSKGALGLEFELWNRISASGACKPTSIIAPYISRGLPPWESLMHIAAHSEKVAVTSVTPEIVEQCKANQKATNPGTEELLLQHVAVSPQSMDPVLANLSGESSIETAAERALNCIPLDNQVDEGDPCCCVTLTSTEILLTEPKLPVALLNIGVMSTL